MIRIQTTLSILHIVIRIIVEGAFHINTTISNTHENILTMWNQRSYINGIIRI